MRKHNVLNVSEALNTRKNVAFERPETLNIVKHMLWIAWYKPCLGWFNIVKHVLWRGPGWKSAARAALSGN